MDQHTYNLIYGDDELGEVRLAPSVPLPGIPNYDLDLNVLGPPPVMYPSRTVTTYTQPITNTFMAAPTTSGHSTRDAVLSVANRGLDFLTQFYASKNPAFAASTGYAPEGGAVAYAADPGGGARQQVGAVGQGIGGFFDGIIDWVRNNTGTAALIGVGAYLLFKEPPRGRR